MLTAIVIFAAAFIINAAFILHRDQKMKCLFAAIGIFVAAFLFNAAFIHIGNWHFVHKPTADELYGCTYAQSDPATGECK
jgi:accessory gene regulator protein AgrB